MKTTVLVVDDSALMRKLITEILGRDRRIEVVGTANDGRAAREKIKKLSPDVITLDVDMPRMDGLTFLANLMRLRPMPVVMVSSLTNDGARVTLRALELGAVDFVAKPTLEDAEQWVGGPAAEELVEKVLAAAGARVQVRESRPRRGTRATEGRGTDAVLTHGEISGLAPARVVAVGASTGGTEAVCELLAPLPPTAAPILVVQHIPGHFSAAFAERLDAQCRLRVREAEDGLLVRAGFVLLAPGDRHLSLERRGDSLYCRLLDSPPVNRHRPSVDVLFRSVARVAGSGAVGVLLTGMGSDGARGLLELKEAGALTVAQDQESSVVWGMPGRAVELGAARLVLPIERIARLCSLRSPRPGGACSG